ncbi:hypothetical protein A3H85_03710 [Candidatus Daviesbacteria bacterium RIFCSPLOWO2_02_FULL_40_8]|nr:MAG: hypothetical protein A3H85_03710 [Candidatus Daviesbacteria bacterium RIFCSPLOWO2_02_FULL_40_8]
MERKLSPENINGSDATPSDPSAVAEYRRFRCVAIAQSTRWMVAGVTRATGRCPRHLEVLAHNAGMDAVNAIVNCMQQGVRRI